MSPATHRPLADRLRPRDVSEIVGQQATVKPLAEAFDRGEPYSFILFGPPGSGKTSLARALAASSGLRWESLSAVSGGLPELRKVIARAEKARDEESVRSGLFIDEIHRWNKSQQDALLPHLESGLITLIGATTENPVAEINSAVRSRVRIYALGRLDRSELSELIDRALGDPELGLGSREISLNAPARETLIELSDGDARRLLNTLERAVIHSEPESGAIALTDREITTAFGAQSSPADEDRYALISALIKSVRGSDVSAAVYWLARLEAAGEEPLYVARRLVVLASEDIGLSDPGALPIAAASALAAREIGAPEAWINLAHATAALALAPKGWASYHALGRARELVQTKGRPPVPPEIRNPRNQLDQALGYGEGYTHASKPGAERQEFLPEELRGAEIFTPDEPGS